MAKCAYPGCELMAHSDPSVSDGPYCCQKCSGLHQRAFFAWEPKWLMFQKNGTKIGSPKFLSWSSFHLRSFHTTESLDIGCASFCTPCLLHLVLGNSKLPSIHIFWHFLKNRVGYNRSYGLPIHIPKYLVIETNSSNSPQLSGLSRCWI